MQVKTTKRYLFTLVRMAIISKSPNKCWSRCGEKGTLVHCWWDCRLGQPLCKTVWKYLYSILPFGYKVWVSISFFHRTLKALFCILLASSVYDKSDKQSFSPYLVGAQWHEFQMFCYSLTGLWATHPHSVHIYIFASLFCLCCLDWVISIIWPSSSLSLSSDFSFCCGVHPLRVLCWLLGVFFQF